MFASRYLMNLNGDTINKLISGMTEDQILSAWNEFVSDLRSTIPETLT